MSWAVWPVANRAARPVAPRPGWDAWKPAGNDGRAAVALRERVMWQSVLGLRDPPDLVDLAALARAVRAG